MSYLFYIWRLNIPKICISCSGKVAFVEGMRRALHRCLVINERWDLQPDSQPSCDIEHLCGLSCYRSCLPPMMRLAPVIMICILYSCSTFSQYNYLNSDVDIVIAQRIASESYIHRSLSIDWLIDLWCILRMFQSETLLVVIVLL